MSQTRGRVPRDLPRRGERAARHDESTTLLALEGGRAAADAIDSLFRDTHTIKGGAGMVGLDEVGELAHAMEDVLAERARAGRVARRAGRAAAARRRRAAPVRATGEATPIAELAAELSSTARRRAAQRLRRAREPPMRRPAARVPSPMRAADVERREAPEDGARALDPGSGREDRPLLDLVGETVLHRRRLEHALGGERPRATRRVSDELDLGERLLDELRTPRSGCGRCRSLDHRAAPARRPRPRDRRGQGGRAGRQRRRDRARPRHPRGALRAARPPAAQRGRARDRAARGARAAGKPGAGGSSCAPSSAAGSSRSSSPTTAAASRRRSLARGAHATGSLADVLAAAGLLDRGRGERARRPRCRPRRRQGAGRVASAAASRCASEPGRGTEVVAAPAARARAARGAARRARRQRLRGAARRASRRWSRSTRRCRSAGARRSSCAARSIPLADLAELLGARRRHRSRRAPRRSSSRPRAGASRCVCDRLLGEEEVVVKSLGPLLASLAGYLGAAILGDGRIALLLDPARARATRRGARPPRRHARPTRWPRAASREGARRRGLVHGARAAAQHPRGRRLPRRDRARRPRGARAAGRDDEIELVVTDVEMPEMDGLELTAGDPRDAATGQLPVVIVTSRGERGGPQARDRGRRRRLHGQATASTSRRCSTPSSGSSAVTPSRRARAS